MFDLREIAREFQEKYGLPRDVVEQEAIAALERELSVRYRRRVWVNWDPEKNSGGVCVWTLGRRDGVPWEFEIPLENIRGWNTLRRAIERALERMVVIRDCEALRPYRNTLVWGEVLLHTAEDVLYVKAEIRQGEPIVCVCPKVLLPKRERRAGFIRGERRAFYYHKHECVYVDGMPRLKVTLSRTSWRLPVLLLKHFLYEAGGRVEGLKLVPIERHAGVISRIAASRPLPREGILQTCRELNERIWVILPPKANRYLRKSARAKKPAGTSETDPYLQAPPERWGREYAAPERMEW
ncbi:MAG TPA: hypothetical protein ENJ62_00355 [Bryobacterales bacterium]|nr:hypothetical protein [Bryobacterales bacterium]